MHRTVCVFQCPATTRTDVRRFGHIPSSRCQDNRCARQRNCDSSTFGRRLRCVRRSGGARRDRTDDLLLAKQALSQLSYGPFRSRDRGWGSHRPPGQLSPAQPGSRYLKRYRPLKMVGLERFELSTSRLSSARSNQLSYRPGKRGGRPNEERETKAAVSRRHFAEPV